MEVVATELTTFIAVFYELLLVCGSESFIECKGCEQTG